MAEAGEHGARACLYFSSERSVWYIVFFSMAVDDRGLNLPVELRSCTFRTKHHTNWNSWLLADHRLL